MQRTIGLLGAALAGILALLGALALALRPGGSPEGAREPPFATLHRAALARLEAGVLDAGPFYAALAAAEGHGEVDRDLYARGIAWLEAGRRDMALAAFREAARGAFEEEEAAP